MATITSACPRNDCRAAFHATGRCTRASGQYWPGAELIHTGGGPLRNKSPIFRVKMRSHGSGSSTKRRRASEAANASLETAFFADCISLDFPVVRTIISLLQHGPAYGFTPKSHSIVRLNNSGGCLPRPGRAFHSRPEQTGPGGQ